MTYESRMGTMFWDSGGTAGGNTGWNTGGAVRGGDAHADMVRDWVWSCSTVGRNCYAEAVLPRTTLAVGTVKGLTTDTLENMLANVAEDSFSERRTLVDIRSEPSGALPP